jgi:hypothetical protein
MTQMSGFLGTTDERRRGWIQPWQRLADLDLCLLFARLRVAPQIPHFRQS